MAKTKEYDNIEVAEESIEAISVEVQEEPVQKPAQVQKSHKARKVKGVVTLITKDGCIVVLDSGENKRLYGPKYLQCSVGEIIEF